MPCFVPIFIGCGLCAFVVVVVVFLGGGELLALGRYSRLASSGLKMLKDIFITRHGSDAIGGIIGTLLTSNMKGDGSHENRRRRLTAAEERNVQIIGPRRAIEALTRIVEVDLTWA